MCERFTSDARAIVVDAERDAIRQNAPEVTSLHVLLALLRRPGGDGEREDRGDEDERGERCVPQTGNQLPGLNHKDQPRALTVLSHPTLLNRVSA